MGWGYGVDLDPVVEELRELRMEQAATQRLLEDLVTELRDIRWAIEGREQPSPRLEGWWERALQRVRRRGR